MIDTVFLQVLNMSFTGGVVILLVLAVRLLLKKAPKAFSYALWVVALFRLVCPVSLQSSFSLLPTRANPIPLGIFYYNQPEIGTGISSLDNAVNAILPAATPYASMNPIQFWVFLGRAVWLIGIVVLLVYSVSSLLALQKKLRSATLERDNIYLCPGLDTAFVTGLLRPKIYLPATLTPQEQTYILLHEQTHIKRFDHAVKLLSFLVLCLHWFNPLVWAAFFVSGRDMEMACDEAVIKRLGNAIKKDYSVSLLTLATGRRMVGGTPLAFGEGDTKSRIKNVLQYHKPAFWVLAVSLAAVVCLGLGLLLNPVQQGRTPVPRPVKHDNLIFSMKPDVTTQSIGKSAAVLWLSSYVNPNVSDSQRLLDVQIDSVNTVTTTPRVGEAWETMDFQYITQVNYTITTDSEQYQSAIDGITGAGVFSGLSRQLYIKAHLPDGVFEIVGVDALDAEKNVIAQPALQSQGA